MVNNSTNINKTNNYLPTYCCSIEIKCTTNLTDKAYCPNLELSRNIYVPSTPFCNSKLSAVFLETFGWNQLKKE